MIKLGIIAGALAAFIFATTAEAARCPGGQIWRVSKKKCQSKALAIKLGIIKPGKKRKARPKSAKKKTVVPVAASKDNGNKTPDESSPAVGASGATENKQPVAQVNNSKDVTKSGKSGENRGPVRKFEPKIVLKSPDGDAEKSSKAGGGSAGDPLAAIDAATSGKRDKPLTTRMVKATYFSASGGQTVTDIKNNDVMKRAVLGLLKSRLQVHAERNRRMYIERGQ